MYSLTHRCHRSVVSFVRVFLPVLNFCLSLYFSFIFIYRSHVHSLILSHSASLSLICVSSFPLSLSISHSLSVTYSHLCFFVHISQSCQSIAMCLRSQTYVLHLLFLLFETTLLYKHNHIYKYKQHSHANTFKILYTCLFQSPYCIFSSLFVGVCVCNCMFMWCTNYSYAR